MKLLVTGASGFVGTWLTKKLLDLGHDVRVITRTGTASFPFNYSKVEIQKADVTDLPSLLSASQNVDTVFHLAGVVGYSRSMRELMHQTNVLGTQNVIEACLKNKCRRLVHMSSVVAIGASFDGRASLDENSEFNLHHLNLGYFETKKQAEDLVLNAVRNSSLDAVILNPSTIYGAGDAKKGSRHTQVKVAQGKFPFYTSGGVNVIHVEDAVAAIYRAWQVGRTGERYILSGENLTIKSLFTQIAEMNHVSPPRIHLPNPIILGLGKLGDLLERFDKKGPINSENAWASLLFHWFDNSKARKELDLDPRPAHEAIAESVNWMKEHIFK